MVAPRSPRGVQLGWLPTLATLLLLMMAAASCATDMMLPTWWFWAHQASAGVALTHALACAFAGIAVLVAGFNLWRLRGLQPGTVGRGRLMAVSVLAASAICIQVAGAELALATLSEADPNPFTKRVDFETVLNTGTAWAQPLLQAAVTAILGLRLLLVAGAIGCWYLAPKALRGALWLTFDVVLASFVAGGLLSRWLITKGSLSVLPFDESVLPVRVGPALLGLLCVSALMAMRAPRLQRGAGRVAEVGILLLAMVAPWLVDLSVPDDQPERVQKAVILLVGVALLGVRALVRWLPRLGDALESFGIETRIATRYLRSKKSNYLTTISLISVVAIMTACATLTLVLSVMGGFRNDLKRKIIGHSAHAVLDADGGSFSPWKDVLEDTKRLPGVVGASPFVSGEVMVTSATNLAGALVRGVDPDAVRNVIELEANLTQGQLRYLKDPDALLDLPERPIGGLPGDLPWLDELPPLPDFGEDLDELVPSAPPREKLPGIIVGRELARSLRLFLGDEVNLVSPFGSLGPQGPMPKSRTFRVAGIFYSGMYEFDMKHVYVRLEEAQRFLNLGDRISGIELRTRSIHEAPAVALALRKQASGYRDREFQGGSRLRVQDWRELNQNLFGALELERLSMFILLGFAILTAGFCVFATITLMVQEKRPQVGILLAMGTAARTIVLIFLVEGFLLGALGAGLGLGLGYLACFSAEHFGLRMDPEVYYIDRLPVHLDPLEFLSVGAAAVVVCTLSTLFPAIWASRLRPVDAMRYD